MYMRVLGLFRDAKEAEAAVHDLRAAGFSKLEISTIALSEPDAVGSEAAGPITSAAAGTATGLVAGLAALALPGIGPIVAAGPLAAALTGAGVGGAAGGVIGALAQAGREGSAEENGFTEEDLARGRSIVSVRCDELDRSKAEAVLKRHGADLALAQGEFTSPADDVDAGMETEFRRHFATTFLNRGKFEEFAGAYHYGRLLGASERYALADWPSVEPDARNHWEAAHPKSWERVRDAVRHAWDYVRGHR